MARLLAQLLAVGLLGVVCAIAAGEAEARGVEDGALSLEREEFAKWVRAGGVRYRMNSPGFDDEEEDEVTFPDAVGDVDPSTGNGFIRTRGGIVLERSGRKVRLSEPAYSRTSRGAVLGIRISGYCRQVRGRRRCVAAKRIELAGLQALRYSPSGDDTHLYVDAKARLTGFAARALNTRLGSTFRGGQQVGSFDAVVRLADLD